MNFPSVVQGGVTCVWSGAATCGEGPVWMPEQSALYWVDIDGCKAHRYEIINKQVTTWTLVEKTGWLLPCQGRKEFIAGCKSGVYLIDLDAGRQTHLFDLEPDQPQNRFNDAKTDSEGRIWAGTIRDGGLEKTGWLYRIESDLSYQRCDGPYAVTNGPAISPDDGILYHVDTHGGVVYAFDKNSDGGLENRRVFVTIDELDGRPDGLTVDNDGYVWIAHWGGYRLTRFTPDGRVDGIVPVPAPQVTSCTFGGADMSTLFITSAARNVDLKIYPNAGGLFCVDTSVTGKVVEPFRMSDRAALLWTDIT
jgi:sugar lactone lactonase YvrE